MYLHPFEEKAVLEKLARGFELAGAPKRPPTLYLQLDRSNRLTGVEIKNLLFGNRIKGEDFWRQTLWKQARRHDGQVTHSGEPIHIVDYVYSHDETVGTGWVEGDRLCQSWPIGETSVTVCEQIYRGPVGGSETYYLVTDMGPHQFQIDN